MFITHYCPLLSSSDFPVIPQVHGKLVIPKTAFSLLPVMAFRFTICRDDAMMPRIPVRALRNTAPM
jgi:hypothetical protein